MKGRRCVPGVRPPYSFGRFDEWQGLPTGLNWPTQSHFASLAWTNEWMTTTMKRVNELMTTTLKRVTEYSECKGCLHLELAFKCKYSDVNKIHDLSSLSDIFTQLTCPPSAWGARKKPLIKYIRGRDCITISLRAPYLLLMIQSRRIKARALCEIQCGICICAR